jgi:hypothetical protein
MADFVTYVLLRIIQVAILVFAIAVFINGFFNN